MRAAVVGAGSLLVLGLSPVAPVVVAGEADGTHVERADRRLVEQVLEESEVDRRVQGPGWPTYVSYVGYRLGSAWLERLGESLVSSGIPWVAVAWILLAAAVSATLAAVVIHWLRRQGATVPTPPAAAGPEAPPASPRSMEEWRTLFEERLAGGDLLAALEALWWWTARRLDPPGLDPSWTTSRLLSATARSDLRPLLRQLDALTFGIRRPQRRQVAGLARQLQGVGR